MRWLIKLLVLLPCQVFAGRPVTISEIGFDRAEFVEFYNHTQTPINLTGYTVIGGIDAFLSGVIQPQAYAVVVGDIVSFRQRHGDLPHILGEFERRLDNQGEEIALRNPSGEVVVRINYQVRSDLHDLTHHWPPNSRSREHPFEFIFPDQGDLIQNDGSNWRIAYRKDGTPGRGTDADQDGLDDEWEQAFLSTLDWNSSDDPDSDDLNNATEQQIGTHPANADTDGDGLTDSQETATGVFTSLQDTGTDPLVYDTDSDGLGDGQEIPIETPEGAFATDPHRSDSDGDSHKDGAEVRYLGDPLDAAIGPKKPSITFGSSSAQYSAGEAVTLSWNIAGSDSRALSPHPEGRTSLYSPSGSIEFLPITKTGILPESQIWRYDRTTIDYGNQWIHPDFDDTDWPTTTMPFWFYPTDGPPTPYFRTSVQIPEIYPGNRIAWHWSFYGGSALYLDGHPFRQHGLVDPYERHSLQLASHDYFLDAPIPFTALSPGRHSIAASAHAVLFNPQSSIFGLTLVQHDPTTGTFSYTLQASNPYGTEEKTVEFTILDDLPPLQTFAQWAVQALPKEIRPDPKADPDDDGRDNLTEFLSASNPLVADDPPLTFEAVQNRTVKVSFLRYRNPANASLLLEQSSNLVDWVPLNSIYDLTAWPGHSLEIVDNSREKLTYPISQNSTPMYFRLRSSMAE